VLQHSFKVSGDITKLSKWPKTYQGLMKEQIKGRKIEQPKLFKGATKFKELDLWYKNKWIYLIFKNIVLTKLVIITKDKKID